MRSALRQIAASGSCSPLVAAGSAPVFSASWGLGRLRRGGLTASVAPEEAPAPADADKKDDKNGNGEKKEDKKPDDKSGDKKDDKKTTEKNTLLAPPPTILIPKVDPVTDVIAIPVLKPTMPISIPVANGNLIVPPSTLAIPQLPIVQMK